MKTARLLLLGLTVLGMLACGGEAKITPTAPEREVPIEEPTNAPRPTITRVSPTPDFMSGMGTPNDIAYLECTAEIWDSMGVFMSDTSDVFNSYSDRIEGFCPVWSAYDFSARLSDRRSRVFEECAMPDGECLLRSRELVRQAFDAFGSAYEKVDLWCVDQNTLDLSLLDDAIDQFLMGNGYLTRATDELQTCPWAE